MVELPSPTHPSRRSQSQTLLWSLSPVGPPLPIQSSSRVSLQLPFLLPSQPSPPLAPPASKRNSHGSVLSPIAEQGWGNPASLATRYRTYAAGPSFADTKPFGFGPDFGARPPPPPPPEVDMRMNEWAEKKRRMKMVHGQKSAFPSTSPGTGIKQNEGGVSKPINIPNANAGVLVKQEECHQLSLADEYGLPKEWTY
ncbi:unnamed protein product [Lupinus luteus]|uniref:Uncharacterized protein n=1 Tax=Lupinus luteus TaxID=3873 RepID=A0AAV1WLP1_LUPLU